MRKPWKRWAALSMIALAGCSERVPNDARLIWSGVPDRPDAFKNLSWEQAGQLYLVDAETGKIEAVRTVWPENPNFRVNLIPGHAYRVYHRPDPSYVATRPVNPAPMTGGR